VVGNATYAFTLICIELNFNEWNFKHKSEYKLLESFNEITWFKKSYSGNLMNDLRISTNKMFRK